MIASLITTTKRACRTRRQTAHDRDEIKDKTRQTTKQNRTTIKADVLNESLHRPVSKANRAILSNTPQKPSPRERRGG